MVDKFVCLSRSCSPRETEPCPLLCRQQGSKIGSTWSALSTAMKVMQHQKAVEKNAELAEAGESQKEQLKLMLDAMWATNALDIQNTVAKACSMVRLAF